MTRGRHRQEETTTEIVGRDVELLELDRLVAAGRLVTVVGLPGSGKTTLARRFVERSGAQFPGGANVVDLGEARSVDGILRLVGAPAARALVVLDGFEPYLAGALADAVRVLLERAPAAVFLVTAREPLGLDGEACLDLALVPEALDAGIAHLEHLAASASLRGDGRAEGTARGYLGILLWEAARFDDAEKCFAQAVDKCRASALTREEGVFAAHLAALRVARRGDPAARVLFDEALAMLAVAQEAPPAVVSLLEGFFEVRASEEARARGDEEEAKAYRAIALARLQAAIASDGETERAFSPSPEARAAARRLERALRDLVDDRRSVPPAARGSSMRSLTIGPGARWFRGSDGVEVDLTRRRALRLLLERLTDKRLEAPGVAMSLDELLAAGWPGERVLPEAGAARVYTAVRALRDLGLRDVLVTRGEGYLLDPDASVLVLGA